MTRTEPDGAETWLVEDQRPSARQTWAAIAVAAVAIAAFAAVAPFTRTPVAQLNAFFPTLDAIVFVTDLVTAVLLFGQFSISRSRALFALASGYLFTSLIVIPHALTFAGAFSETGLLGANIQTGSWLFIFWHIGFAAALLAYAVLRGASRAPHRSESSSLRAIGISVAAVIVLVCGLTWLATAGASMLPPIILDRTRMSPIVIYPVWFTILISAAALIVLWFRRRSVLDQWLIVVALVFILELAFSGLLPSVRFSAGFYAGRACSLVTSSIVLIVLLAETTRLYVRLARSNATLQREHAHRLMSVDAATAAIAHELRQPLAALSMRCSAALNWLKRTPPDLAEVRACLTATIDESSRANEIIASIRALFKTTAHQGTLVDMNRLVREVLRTVENDLHVQGVSVSTEFQEGLPQIMADPIQLQQVILNLVKNGIEAMATGPTTMRVLRLVTTRRGDSIVSLWVQDSGPGISPENGTQIFDPFFTTKSSGMGLGLSICRRIIEEHGGDLQLTKSGSNGCTFEITLPSVATSDSGGLRRTAAAAGAGI
jgi:signal transduction histidine kinase